MRTTANTMLLTDQEALNITRAKGLLRVVGDLADPITDKAKPMREIDREALSIYVRIVEELLPDRF